MNNEKTRKIFDNKYEILKIVGRGESSVVYHARKIQDKSDVALKVLIQKDGRDNKEILRRESLALVSCRNKNVIKLEDFQTLSGLCYLVMEYARYKDVVQYLNGKLLGYEQGEAFLKQALSALDFIHKTGFIHRDIVPENLLITSDETMKLSDFGSGVVVYELSNSKDFKKDISKNSFIAPEYFNNNEINFYSDIYSMGKSFLYLFTHSYSNISSITNFKLATCLKKMLEENPKDRFQTATQVLDFLDLGNVNVGSSVKLNNSNHILDDLESNNVVTSLNDDKFEVEPRKDIDNSMKNNDINTEKTINKINNNAVDNSVKEMIRDELNSDQKPFSLGESTGKTLEELNKEKLKKLKSSKKNNINKKDMKEDTYCDKSSNAKIKLVLSIILLIVLYFLFASFGLFGGDSKDSNITNDGFEYGDLDKIEGKSKELTFPNLVDGLYYGEFYNVLMDKVSFSLVSKDNNIIFTIKENGFNPIASSNISEGILEIRFNGVVLDFNAKEIGNGKITGEVLNKITGERGKWRLKFIK